jgi:predicted P-loop ATPase
MLARGALHRRHDRRARAAGSVMNAVTLVDTTNATPIPAIDAPLVPNKTDIASHKVGITFLPTKSGSSMTAKAVTLAELRDLILAAEGETKGRLPWLKGARFGDKRTPKGSLRHDANVIGFDMIELDYDKEVMGLDEAIIAIKAANIRALIYTTPSHTNAKPRWRLLMPVSRGDLVLETRGKLCARVNGCFGGMFAPESFTLSQGYYYGLAADNPDPDHRCEIIDGRLIDLCDDLYKFQKDGFPKGKAASPPTTSTVATKPRTGNLYSENFKFEAHLASVGDGGDLQGFNNPLSRAASSYAYHHGADFDREALKGRLREVINAAPKGGGRKPADITRYFSDEYLDGIIESGVKKYGTAKVDNARWGDFEWRERRPNNQPFPSMHNARVAITALGVVCSKDTFHNKTLFGYAGDEVKHELASIVGEVSDDGIIALRQLMSDRFGFDLTDKHTRDAVVSLALDNCFDPVRDLIDKAQAEWDGVERLNSMAVDYFNCAGTEINCAFIRKTMIAMVARARVPGIKFDTITVLESKEGFNKSTAWKILAGEENFSDEKIIGKEAREVQEQLSGIWIHENADLAGLKKTDIESVKAYASRQIDIARPAFGHFVIKQPRHSIDVGTTNSPEYLQSQTGNRRFWPLEVLASIDIKKLSDDRLQLIGEAARYQSAGESLVLDEPLWGAAGDEQEQRRVKDPWEDELANIPVWGKEIKGYDNGIPVERAVMILYADEGMKREMVSGQSLLKHLLDIPIAHQTTMTGMRLSAVMKQLGWERAKNGYVSIGGERVKGYYRDSDLESHYRARVEKLKEDAAADRAQAERLAGDGSHPF